MTTTTHDTETALRERTTLRPRDRLILLVASLVLLIPGAFTTSLTNRDEGWYAQVSREMLDSGDWVIPHYLDEPWIAKPPLLYWCVARSFSVFGKSAGAARIVSILAMIGVVQLMADLACRLYNRRTAMIASVALITAPLPLMLGKLVLTDALLLLCMLSAMWLAHCFIARRASGWIALGMWACVGLAVLAKGPAIVLFGGSFLAAMLISHPSRRWLIDWRLWAGLPVALLIAVPWYMLAAGRAGGTLVEQFLLYEILSRFTEPPHGHVGPPGYYVAVVLVGWFPWTVLVPGAVIEAWQARRQDASARMLLVWCFLPWAALALIPSKLPHYILPCCVPLAILFGRMWDVGLARPVQPRQRIILGVWVLSGIAGGIAMAIVGWRFGGDVIAVPAVIAGALLVVGFGIVGWQAMASRLWRAWRAAAVSIGACHIVVFAWLLPALEPHRLSRNIAHAANARAAPDQPVFACGYDEPTLFFYLDRPARVVRPDDLARLLEHADGALLIISEQCLEACSLRPDDLSQSPTRVTGFNYVKGERAAVWIGRITDAGSTPVTP